MLPDKQYPLAHDIELKKHQTNQIQRNDFHQLPQISEISDKSLNSPNNRNISLQSLLTNHQTQKRTNPTTVAHRQQLNIEVNDDSDEIDGGSNNNYCSDSFLVKNMSNERTTIASLSSRTTLNEDDIYTKQFEALTIGSSNSNITPSNVCHPKGQEANEEPSGFDDDANNHSNIFDKRHQVMADDNMADVASQHNINNSNDDKQNLDNTVTPPMMFETNNKTDCKEYHKVFNKTIDSDDAAENSGNNHKTTAKTAVEQRSDETTDVADNCKVDNVKHNECHKTFSSCSSLESAALATLRLHAMPTNQTTHNMSLHIKPEEYVAIPTLMTAATFSSSASSLEHSEKHKFQSHEAMNQPTYSSVPSLRPSYDFMQQSYQHHQLYQYHHPHQEEQFRSHHQHLPQQQHKQRFQHHNHHQLSQQQYTDNVSFFPIASHTALQENYGVCSTGAGVGESSTTTSLTI
ncbi:bromodomain-containing protein DDB_G0280777-like, partial [Musca vetustissima]|uniref:bromodomain-containing protein DDB_G0280777-like n=1 Tax=Musca vetustissima TaxID=27455 RepID=UPI002AB60FC7